MKSFSDLCKTTIKLRIEVEIDNVAYLTEDEVSKYYSFAAHIHLPQQLITNILVCTKGEVYESLRLIWQLFLPQLHYEREKHLSCSSNPYRTQHKHSPHWSSSLNHCYYCALLQHNSQDAEVLQ